MKQIWASLLLVSTLFGCGGGGGGSGGQGISQDGPAAIPSPSARLTSMIPSNGETGVTRNVKPVITLAVTIATTSDAKRLSFLCNNRMIPFTSVSNLNVDTKSIVITLTPEAGAILLGDDCVLSGNITTTGAGGGVETPIAVSFSIIPIPNCVLPATWSSTGIACVSPSAVLVSGANQLQVCGTDLLECLKNGMLYGKVKIISSTYTFNNRQISFAYFRNERGLFVVLPLYADDLSLVGNAIDILGGTNQTLDNVIGAYNGAIAHNPDTGLCVVVSVNPIDKSPLFNTSPCVVFPK